VIGFPLLFETQPRPIPVDLPIDIPPRNASGAYETGGLASPHGTHGASGSATTAAVPQPAGSATPPESVSYDVRSSSPAGQPARTTVATAPEPVATAQEEKPPATTKPVAAVPKPSTGASRPATGPRVAQADLPPAPSASSTAAAAAILEAPNPAVDRYIVQIAAFKPTDDAKIRDIRGRVEKLGLKTYTQPVKTPAGEWIRVRVGPYPTKAEADSAVAKIAGAGLGLQPKVYMP